MAELKILFGVMLRRHRKLRGLSQVALAEKAALSLETIARVERGNSGASFDVVERLAHALDVRPAALFGVDLTGGPSDEFEALMVALSKLDRERLIWLRGVIEAVLPGIIAGA